MVFIIIRHGDNKETLFNANCMVASLLDNIKDRCGVDRSINIDLFDGSGSVCQLEGNLNDNASKFTKEREKYVLVKKEKTNEKGKISYTCLLKGLQNTDPELLALIEGRPTEADETLPTVPSEQLERRKSVKPPEKRLSIALSVKRKGRYVNKIY